MAATGDYGSEAAHQFNRSKLLAVDDPSSEPFVTGVGGTQWTADGTPPSETAWNNHSPSFGSGGGGLSAIWTMPGYQSTAASGLGVINKYSSGKPCAAPTGKLCREVPDVSASGGPVPVPVHDGPGVAELGRHQFRYPVVGRSDRAQRCFGIVQRNDNWVRQPVAVPGGDQQAGLLS